MVSRNADVKATEKTFVASTLHSNRRLLLAVRSRLTIPTSGTVHVGLKMAGCVGGYSNMSRVHSSLLVCWTRYHDP